MGIYIVIGGDGKEYGPISDTDIRQWFTEGRLSSASLIKTTSDAEFRPLNRFPEFADLYAPGVPTELNSQATLDSLETDYQLDLGSCISSGFELFKKHFGTLFVAVIVLIVIKFALAAFFNLLLMSELTKIFTSPLATVALAFLLSALNAPIMGPLTGGLYLIYLKCLRGQPTGLNDLFSGFEKYWSRLFLGNLFVGWVLALCMAPASYVVAAHTNPILAQLQALKSQNSDPTESTKLLVQLFQAYGSALPVILICLIPLSYLSTCWQFTLPLIIDKNLPLAEALKFGWQRVNLHWWLVFGLTVIAYLIAVLGLLGCGLGILFTLPLGTAIIMFGYESIFTQKNK